MFDVSKLTVDNVFKSIDSKKNDRQYGIYYKYGDKSGLAYARATDELGAYQGLLKQLEERYKNG